MGIRESAYQQQAKRMDATLECKKISDARRFINKQINYLEKKAINNMKVQIFADFNDKKFEDSNWWE
ncbi:MAG: hypothetical protein IJ215_03705 [Clostridia bacterium]|nr:hypothetical protein [Clostridia bacterium]